MKKLTKLTSYHLTTWREPQWKLRLFNRSTSICSINFSFCSAQLTSLKTINRTWKGWKGYENINPSCKANKLLFKKVLSNSLEIQLVVLQWGRSICHRWYFSKCQLLGSFWSFFVIIKVIFFFQEFWICLMFNSATHWICFFQKIYDTTRSEVK